VLYVGISDSPAWWIAQANTLAHLRGWSPIIGLQIEYSLIERTGAASRGYERRHDEGVPEQQLTGRIVVR
jgi:aryl-alcohol dehydrogenase-like predicted oxidoreductase